MEKQELIDADTRVIPSENRREETTREQPASNAAAQVPEASDLRNAFAEFAVVCCKISAVLIMVAGLCLFFVTLRQNDWLGSCLLIASICAGASVFFALGTIVRLLAVIAAKRS